MQCFTLFRLAIPLSKAFDRDADTLQAMAALWARELAYLHCDDAELLKIGEKYVREKSVHPTLSEFMEYIEDSRALYRNMPLGRWLPEDEETVREWQRERMKLGLPSDERYYVEYARLAGNENRPAQARCGG